MESYTETEAGTFPSPNQTRWIVAALLAYFAVRALYFAVSISPYVPPDEVTHFGVCTVFSKYLLLPVNSPESYQYGLVTNIPWLYYFLMGKLLHLNFFGVSDLVFLRILNTPLACATVYYVWRLARLLTEDRLAQILVLVAMTNTLMFSFLAGTVSYDNLLNLLAAMAIYYLFAFFKERSPHQAALSLLAILAGCLTKTSFIPLGALLALVFLLHEIGNLAGLPGALQQYFRSQGRVALLLLTGILVALGLNLHLYLGNHLKYGMINPPVETVLPLENAMKYRLTARNYIFRLFREGKITMEKAAEMAQQITHPGDRQDTITIVQNYADLQQSGFKPMGLLPYSAIWTLQMLSTSFGIKAHVGMPNAGFSFIPLMLLILFVLAAHLVRWRPWDRKEWVPTSLLGISICYAVFLMYKINYQNYLESKDIVMTVAGRYIFPVMGPVYVVSSMYLMRLFQGEKGRLALAAFAALALLASDFPFFLSHVTPEWYDWSAR